MNVVDAVHARSSIRDFLDTPVDDQVLRDLLVGCRAGTQRGERAAVAGLRRERPVDGPAA
jgi:hypothetical protein